MSLVISVPSIATNSQTQFGKIATPPPSPNMKKRNLTLPSFAPTSPLATSPPPPLSPKPRRKPLGPGCGLLDWIRLCRSGKDLTTVGGKLQTVTEEELAKHNTPDDAWTAIRGKVYNITPYMKFHPGGKEDLMRGAGMDCTILFDEVHKWVNVESMLSKCVVGTLVVSSSARRSSFRANSLSVPKPIVVPDGMNSQAIPRRKSSMELRNETRAAEACEEDDGQRQVSPESPVKPLVHEMPGTKQDASSKQEHEFVDEPSATLPVPPMRPRKNSDASKPKPSFNWVQSEKSVVLHVLTQGKALKPSDVFLDVNGKTFEATIAIMDWVYELNIALAHPVSGSQVTVNGARAEISLRKQEHEQWDVLGSFLPGHNVVTHKSKRVPKTHLCTIEDIKTITHDTKIFKVKFSPGSFMIVPTGHHVSIQAHIDGKQVERSYTPVLPLSDHRPDGSSLELMIKLYKNGRMSQYLSRLSSGDSIVVTDPEGTFDSSRLSSANNVVLIAAGTGFTPMAKVIRDLVCSNEHRKNRSTKLLFANKTEEDVLWRSELEQLTKSTQNFEMVTVLSNPGNTWRGCRGRIDSRVLKEHLPPVTEDKTLICICGPCPFTTGISNILFDMEYPGDCIHCFT